MKYTKLFLITTLFIGCALEAGQIIALSSDDRDDYFPPPEYEGGWRKNTDPEFIRSMGLDPVRLEEFGQYNLSVPNGNWKPYSEYKGIIVEYRQLLASCWKYAVYLPFIRN